MASKVKATLTNNIFDESLLIAILEKLPGSERIINSNIILRASKDISSAVWTETHDVKLNR